VCLQAGWTPERTSFDTASILYSLIFFVMIEYNLEIHKNTKDIINLGTISGPMGVITN
jgi:hypothetical protein